MRATQDINVKPLPRIAYSQSPDGTPEAEIGALAAVYRIVLNANHKGRLPDRSGPDDAERYLSDSASKHSTT